MDEQQRSLFEKLLRLALCPSATQGEWNVAAQKLVSLMRKSGTSAEELLSLPSGGRKGHGHSAPPPPGGISSLWMPFGKYKGQMVDWIARYDPGYLFWILANVERLSPVLREEIKRCLAWR